MRHPCLLLAGIFFLGLFLVLTVSAAENTSGTETVLFTLKGEPSCLILDGDRLFWLQDSKYLNATEQGFYSYNLTDKSKKQIYRLGHQRDLTGPVPTVFESPGGQVISGDQVVYSENGIMLTNIPTGSTVQLTNQNDSILPVSELRHNQNPWIDGDRIVWTEHEGGSYSSVSGGRIVLLNLTTGRREYVPAGMPGNQSYPRISGNFIIWRDYRGNKDYPDLYLMDIRTGTETRLTAPKTLRGTPFIQGDSVFWEEKNLLGIDTIVCYTISNGTRLDVGPGWMGQTGASPPVSGDRIVWKVPKNPSDIREEQGAIMVMDLRTGEKIQITSFGKGVSFPVISGDRIVYTRGAGDDWFKEPREVVLYTLAAPRPSAITTHSGTGTDNGGTRQPLAQYSGVQTGATPAAPAGLPGMVSIAGVMAGVSLWWRTRKELRR